MCAGVMAADGCSQPGSWRQLLEDVLSGGLLLKHADAALRLPHQVADGQSERA